MWRSSASTLLLAASCSIASLAGIAAGQAVDAGSFSPYDNYDVEGNDLKQIRDTDIPTCESSCRFESACVAYSFDKWNRMCFLKHSVRLFRLEPNSISGIRAGAIETPVMAATPITIQRYRKKAFPEHGQQSRRAASFDECEQRYQQDTSCVALTFIKKSSQCRLLKTTGEYFADPDADSGVKRQEPGG